MPAKKSAKKTAKKRAKNATARRLLAEDSSADAHASPAGSPDRIPAAARFADLSSARTASAAEHFSRASLGVFLRTSWQASGFLFAVACCNRTLQSIAPGDADERVFARDVFRLAMKRPFREQVGRIPPRCLRAHAVRPQDGPPPARV